MTTLHIATALVVMPILIFIAMAVSAVRPRPVATGLIVFSIISIALIFGLASWAAAGGRA